MVRLIINIFNLTCNYSVMNNAMPTGSQEKANCVQEVGTNKLQQGVVDAFNLPRKIIEGVRSRVSEAVKTVMNGSRDERFELLKDVGGGAAKAGGAVAVGAMLASNVACTNQEAKAENTSSPSATYEPAGRTNPIPAPENAVQVQEDGVLTVGGTQVAVLDNVGNNVSGDKPKTEAELLKEKFSKMTPAERPKFVRENLGIDITSMIDRVEPVENPPVQSIDNDLQKMAQVLPASQFVSETITAENLLDWMKKMTIDRPSSGDEMLHDRLQIRLDESISNNPELEAKILDSFNTLNTKITELANANPEGTIDNTVIDQLVQAILSCQVNFDTYADSKEGVSDSIKLALSNDIYEAVALYALVFEGQEEANSFNADALRVYVGQGEYTVTEMSSKVINALNKMGVETSFEMLAHLDKDYENVMAHLNELGRKKKGYLNFLNERVSPELAKVFVRAYNSGNPELTDTPEGRAELSKTAGKYVSSLRSTLENIADGSGSAVGDVVKNMESLEGMTNGFVTPDLKDQLVKLKAELDNLYELRMAELKAEGDRLDASIASSRKCIAIMEGIIKAFGGEEVVAEKPENPEKNQELAEA